MSRERELQGRGEEGGDSAGTRGVRLG